MDCIYIYGGGSLSIYISKYTYPDSKYIYMFVVSSSSALSSEKDIFLILMMMMMRGQQLIRRLTMRGGCVRAQNLRRSGRVPISGSYIIRACSTESLKKEVRACFVFVR